MENNPIIQTRLNQLINKKTSVLKLKKAQRGNQVESINQTINRLKSWIQDPQTMIHQPGKPKVKMMSYTSKAIEELKKAMADLGGFQYMTGGHTESERQEFQDMIIWDDPIETQDHSVDALAYWHQMTQKARGIEVDLGETQGKKIVLVPDALKDRICSWADALKKRN